MESQSVFQAETQAKEISIESPPRAPFRRSNVANTMNDVVTSATKNAHAHPIKLPHSLPRCSKEGRKEGTLARSNSRSYFNFALKTPNYTLDRRRRHPPSVRPSDHGPRHIVCPSRDEGATARLTACIDCIPCYIPSKAGSTKSQNPQTKWMCKSIQALSSISSSLQSVLLYVGIKGES